VTLQLAGLRHPKACAARQQGGRGGGQGGGSLLAENPHPSGLPGEAGNRRQAEGQPESPFQTESQGTPGGSPEA